MKNLFKLLPVALLGLTLASCNDNDDMVSSDARNVLPSSFQL